MPKTRKATKLAEAARERGRARARGRFRESVETPKGYKAAGFSLYSRHLNFVDEVTLALKPMACPRQISPSSCSKPSNDSKRTSAACSPRRDTSSIFSRERRSELPERDL